MKKLAFIICMALVPMISFAQQATAKTDNTLKPIMQFEKKVVDYGTIALNSDKIRYFNIKNVGSAPLIIEKVTGSCGCTVPTKPEEPIMPGKSGQIKVSYATDRVGRISKTITIVSNATEKPKVVRVIGEVLKD